MNLGPVKTVYDLRALSVMIIDDNDHMLDIVRVLLKSMRVWDIRSVNDPVTAFTEMKQRLPDIIIVDWNMIPIDGLEFVRLIRRSADSPYPEVPILLLTAHTEMQRVLDARDSGVNRVMAKPVSFGTLYENIAAIIEDDRPFVKTANYVGPCRRYKKSEVRVDRRRKQK